MFSWIIFIFGIAIGVLSTLAYTKKLQLRKVSWLMVTIGMLFTLITFEVGINSLAEYESKAATLGSGLFAIFAIIFYISAWRFQKNKN